MCGATMQRSSFSHVDEGLSPRVWGNHFSTLPDDERTRSIPTCVGQPDASMLRTLAATVYPHVCGATSPLLTLLAGNQGLSPRVWGNPAGQHLE